MRPAVVLALVGIAGSMLHGCAEPKDPADLVLLNGKIVTLDPHFGQAQALAARQGLILAVGSDAEVRAHIGPNTRVIDLQGRLAIPGLIESHGHFTGLGRSLGNVDLRGARNWDDIVARVAAAAKGLAPGTWIYGRGWHQEKWDRQPARIVMDYPTHHELSRAVPDHPVLLTHASGHAGLANAMALELSGITRDTEDPEGGTIVRDADGEPTGALNENAQQLVQEAYERWLSRRTPTEVEAAERAAIASADRECLAKGITTFVDAGSDFATVDRLRSLAETGDLGLRLWVMLRADNDELARRIDAYRIEGAGEGHLTVRAIKKFADGALGSHGAWLLAPYRDMPQSTGLSTTAPEEIEATARLAAAHGFQLCVHAIGDRANRETLDLYERVLGALPDGTDRRWRIEHVQHLDPADVPRFARLGVIASMQPVHCTSDGPWVPERLGPERAAAGAYVWRKLLDSGALVVSGTDVPVEDVDPIANYHAAVTRKMVNGEAFYPDQRMTRIEALRAYTIDAAYATFEEQIKGSLEPGKLADVTVLSQDILTVPEEQIENTRVEATIVGGRVLYERQVP